MIILDIHTETIPARQMAFIRFLISNRANTIQGGDTKRTIGNMARACEKEGIKASLCNEDGIVLANWISDPDFIRPGTVLSLEFEDAYQEALWVMQYSPYHMFMNMRIPLLYTPPGSTSHSGLIPAF